QKRNAASVSMFSTGRVPCSTATANDGRLVNDFQNPGTRVVLNAKAFHTPATSTDSCPLPLILLPLHLQLMRLSVSLTTWELRTTQIQISDKASVTTCISKECSVASAILAHQPS